MLSPDVRAEFLWEFHSRLLRQVVGPPAGVDWSQPWHEILHLWHDRLNQILTEHGTRTWSRESLKKYWDLAGYVVRLPPERWVQRALTWTPHGSRSQGRPLLSWDARLVAFCHENHIGSWREAAQDGVAWAAMTEDFLDFVLV